MKRQPYQTRLRGNPAACRLSYLIQRRSVLLRATLRLLQSTREDTIFYWEGINFNTSMLIDMNAEIESLWHLWASMPFALKRDLAGIRNQDNRLVLRYWISTAIYRCLEDGVNPDYRHVYARGKSSFDYANIKKRTLQREIRLTLKIGPESASPLTEPNHNMHVGGAHHDYAQLSHRRDRRAIRIPRMARIAPH